MRPVVLALAVAVAACNPLFGIEQTELRDDAAPPPDEDMDGVPDSVDNCPRVANLDQFDNDEDSVGDRCDSCPLVSNQDQEHGGDNDPVGDACDGRPTVGGDCLVLFDTFADAAHFDDHWEISSSGAAPSIASNAGSVTVTPPPNTAIALAARDDQGALLQGVFDTQLRARVSVVAGSLQAASNISATIRGFGCGIAYNATLGPQVIVRSRSATAGGVPFMRGLSNDPATTDAVLRLFAPDINDPEVRCRVEYGFAVGTHGMTPNMSEIPIGGAPGVYVEHDPAELDAIALYRAQSTPCAPTVYR